MSKEANDQNEPLRSSEAILSLSRKAMANSQTEQDLQILKHVERNPDITQADLAAQLGVAIGSVNWYLKRLIQKGHIKVHQMQRRRLRYLITPQGLAEKARLTASFMEVSLRVYRELREAARETLARVREAGYAGVKADGKSEAMEIFRLTCLEEGMPLEQALSSPLPEVRVDGMGFVVGWPE